MGGATRGASMNDKEIGVPSWELYPPLPSNPTHFAFLDETLPYNLYPVCLFATLFLTTFYKFTETWSKELISKYLVV